LIIGTTLVVVGILSFINVFGVFIEIFTYPGIVLINFYLIVFGAMIMASSFNMPCIKRNFFFLLTGLGKGLFNMWVGICLFVAGEDKLMN